MTTVAVSYQVRADDVARARDLFVSLVKLRDATNDLIDQIRTGDHSGVQARAWDLACETSEVAVYCRRNAADLARLQDFTLEIDLVKQVNDAIRSAMTADTITPAVDYDLCLLQKATLHLWEMLGRNFRRPRIPRADGDPPTLPFPASREDTAGHELAASGVRISSPAGRLLKAASWLLPPSDRARYGREYEVELWELAHAGAGRVSQLLYAQRQTLRAAQVRHVLLAPRSRSVGP